MTQVRRPLLPVLSTLALLFATSPSHPYLPTPTSGLAGVHGPTPSQSSSGFVPGRRFILRSISPVKLSL